MNLSKPTRQTQLLLTCLLSTLTLACYADIYIYENRWGQVLYSDRQIDQREYRLIQKKGEATRNQQHKPSFIETRLHANGVINLDNRGKQPAIKLAKGHNKFDAVIQYAARSYAIDPALIKAVIHAESSFNPRAISHVGAQGLMQLMPATAGMYSVRDPYNPKQNIMAGSKHLKYLLDKYNNTVELALAAYNAGEGRVKKYNGIPPFPETRNYIKKVKRLKRDYARLASL